MRLINAFVSEATPEVRASIRPRHDHRGELTVSSSGATWTIELQFGHGTITVESACTGKEASRGLMRFNSATALSPWRAEQINTVMDANYAELQFGHGTITVESGWGFP